MQKQAVVVASNDSAIFSLLRVELVMEGEPGDVAGPGSDPDGLLLQLLLRARPLAHQCIQLEVQVPRQREEERHRGAGTSSGDAPLMKPVRPHLQP